MELKGRSRPEPSESVSGFVKVTIYEEVFREFERKEVRYLVVGGMAVNLYGYVRLTVDLDFMADLLEKNGSLSKSPSKSYFVGRHRITAFAEMT